MSHSITDIIKNPALLLLTLGHREYFNWVSDKSYLKIAFWARMHKKLDLEHPKSFSEKLQWLKLSERTEGAPRARNADLRGKAQAS